MSDTKHDQLVRVPTAEAAAAWTGSSRSPSAAPRIRIEVVAGITTWLTMAYILFLNPQILGFAGIPDLQPLGLPFGRPDGDRPGRRASRRSRWASGRTTRSRSRRASG